MYPAGWHLGAIAALALTTAAAEDGKIVASSGTVTIAATPVEFTLASPQAEPDKPLTTRLRQTRSAHLSLVLSELSADVPPGTTYNVFLGHAPPGANAGDPHYVGTFGLFDIAESGQSIPFDVTERIATLLEGGDLTDPLVVSIVPRGGKPGPISIARIELLEQ
ncbi:MAG TPA: hypothetical protein VM689_10050 [Aliidongia sp.]|nr:hypothetical protein [Aliidongia sp.]